MGYPSKSIPFFTDTIILNVHSASLVKDLGHTSIKTFADGRPVSLEQNTHTGEYIVRCGQDFMQGVEFVETEKETTKCP